MNELFKSLSEKICHLIHEEGLLVRSFSNPKLTFFSTLILEEQKTVLADLKSYLEICEILKAQGHSLKNTRLLTDQALKNLDLTTSSTYLDVIQDHHLVEIYNLNHTQIFRSIKFFEVSSYTFEDVYCRKWWHLYERSPVDEARLQGIVADFLQNDPKTLLEVEMPEHSIKEKDTLERLTVNTQILWLIPLYRGTEFAAIMAVETSHL